LLLFLPQHFKIYPSHYRKPKKARKKEMGNTMSESNDGKSAWWEASEYHSQYVRHTRDLASTHALDLSKIGPTKVKSLPWSPH
jgi:hypothetical protein